MKTFPTPRGPNNVGAADVMTPGAPDVSIFGRICYPTTLKASEHPHRWVDYWEPAFFKGIHRFLRSLTSRWPTWAPSGDYFCLWMTRIALALCPEFVFLAGARLLIGPTQLQLVQDAPLRPSPDRYPVIVFSHGIGCNRYLYSQICYDLASLGFVVAAVEHRDGSSSLSRYYDPVNGKMTEVHYASVSHEDDDYTIRNSQVHKRASEVSRMLDFLVRLNEGGEVLNVLDSARDDREPMDWGRFVDHLEISKSYVVGHSFGGATVFLTMSKDDRFRAGVAMDAWMFPLRDEVRLLAETVDKHLLLINTESFRSRENLKRQAEFETAPSPDVIRKSVYIRGSVHQNHTDFSTMFKGRFFRSFLGAKSDVDPVEFMDLNNNLAVQFIWSDSHGFSHPVIDQDVLSSKGLLKWGFDHDDAPLVEEPEDEDIEKLVRERAFKRYGVPM